MEGSLGSILSRQFGCCPHPQLNIQQRLTLHALSPHLTFLAAHFDFWFVAKHVEGNANSLVDDLSCDNLPHFFSQVPKAEYNKSPQVPTSLLNLLGYNHHIWTSTDWIRLFKNTYYTAALTPGTHNTYKGAERKHLTFCIDFNFSPRPTSECFLYYVTTYLGWEGLASSTICTYLSVRQMLIAAGFPDPQIDHMPHLRQLLKDIKVQAVRIG